MDFIITGLTHDFKRERQKPKSAALFFYFKQYTERIRFYLPALLFFCACLLLAMLFLAFCSGFLDLFLLKKCYGRRVAVWPPAGVFTSHYGVITIFVHGSICLFPSIPRHLHFLWIIFIKGIACYHCDVCFSRSWKRQRERQEGGEIRRLECFWIAVRRGVMGIGESQREE